MIIIAAKHFFLEKFGQICRMFEKLQSKWKVTGGRLLLIIVTFALGGSLCGYAGRKILQLTSLDKGFLWILLYILLITLLWPVCVLIISIPLGQFSFFRQYLKRIFARMSGRRKAEGHVINTAIFASGAGSNAEKLVAYFKESFPDSIKTSLIVTNNPKAGVLNVAATAGVPAEIINLKDKNEEKAAQAYFELLKKYKIDFIILAGYLKKIPSALIKAYPEKIVNIHPALLPAYGGAGMYGSRVHEAIVAAGEKESGITIHFVDEIYDHGRIIFQAKCPVEQTDTAATLAKKIHELEHTHFGRVAGGVISGK